MKFVKTERVISQKEIFQHLKRSFFGIVFELCLYPYNKLNMNSESVKYFMQRWKGPQKSHKIIQRNLDLV